MDQIPDMMAVSEARANLSEVVNTVRLQDRIVRLQRRGIPQAAVVPDDVAVLVEQVGGLRAARDVLRNATE